MIRIILALLVIQLMSGCSEPPATSREVQSDPDPGSIAAMVRIPVDEHGKPDPGKAAKIEFDEPVHRFGAVTEGSIVEHEFTFTNTGAVALIVSDAKSTCGCTVPELPKDPIPPGERGKIMARFNTKGKEGIQTKSISVLANTIPAESKLTFTGEVLPLSN
jgi:hypothetical protein